MHMKKISGVLSCLAMAGLILATSASADEWRFPVGPTFMSGFKKVYDFYKDVEDADSGLMIPVGISFTPYYEFTHGSMLGLEVGPISAVFMEERGSSSSTSVKYWAVPLGFTYGFMFMPSASISPFAKVGVKYHIVGGDYIDKSTPGFYGGAGVEFLRNKMVGISVELGYDSSEVTFGEGGYTEDIRPAQFMASVRAVF